MGLFSKIKAGLQKTHQKLVHELKRIVTLSPKLSTASLGDIEAALMAADLGRAMTQRITAAVKVAYESQGRGGEEVLTIARREVEAAFAGNDPALRREASGVTVVSVVGVNGTGKTTTTAKLAHWLRAEKRTAVIAACDTFRAAAIEQLNIWGERTGSPVVASKLGADAAGLAYDAFEKAKAAGSDVLIIDTAGRLQNKTELMAELEKIVRVLGKLDPDAPHTVLQTVDATTGQNALNQVEIFRNVAGVNGLVMTKLDGTARGGILVAIAAKHRLPVYFIGVGEQVDDLEPFSARDFARAIAGVA